MRPEPLTSLSTNFRPRRFLEGPHRQTIVSWLGISNDSLPSTRVLQVPLDDGNFTTVHLNSPQEAASEAPVLVMVHGLEGDATRPYLLRCARKALGYGFRAARMNMRCCGDAEGLSTKFYNGAQSEDVAAVCRCVREQHPGAPIFLAGFSLGGNLVLKAAGEKRIEGLIGVVSVCPPIEPFLSAKSISHWKNAHYQFNFVMSMVERVDRHIARHRLAERYPLSKRMALIEFDEFFTVPHGGFSSLDHYYSVCSPKRLLSEIDCPWLIITSQDDPIVPYESFRHLEGSGHLLAPAQGGHLGFIGHGEPDDPDYYWAENRALEFFKRIPLGCAT